MSATPYAQRNKDADLRRWSPTSHHDARTNQQALHQTYPQSLPCAPVIRHQTAKLSQSKAANHRPQSRQTPLLPQVVATKSP
jgi:hypothetical protein